MIAHFDPAPPQFAARSTFGQSALLDLVNAAQAVDDLRDTLGRAGVAAALAEALIQHRNRHGSFRTTAEIEQVEGLGTQGVAALLGALDRPAFDPAAEKLEYMMWTHGSSLTVESPERFNRIERRPSGLRLHGLTFNERTDYVPGQSNVIASIPTPAFALDKQFHVRSILLNMQSSPAPFGRQGHPLATPLTASLWDGHLRTADVDLRPLPDPINRYLRVPLPATPKIRWGIGVNLDVYVRPSFEQSSQRFWLEISAVGVELVTRTGELVVADH